MLAVIALRVTVAVGIVVTRIGTVALMATGLSGHALAQRRAGPEGEHEWAVPEQHRISRTEQANHPHTARPPR